MKAFFKVSKRQQESAFARVLLQTDARLHQNICRPRLSSACHIPDNDAEHHLNFNEANRQYGEATAEEYSEEICVELGDCQLSDAEYIFQAFGLDGEDPTNNLKTRYREFAKKHHPDKVGSNQKQRASQLMGLANEMFNELIKRDR